MIQHSDQLINGICIAIKELIPSVDINCSIKKDYIIKDERSKVRCINGYSGFFQHENYFIFWFDYSDAQKVIISIKRSPIPLTKIEIKVLSKLPYAISGVMLSSTTEGDHLSQKISGFFAFEHILISKFIRRNNNNNFWTPAFVIHQLQELTFKRYEGSPCTTGFVFTSQPLLYIPAVNKDYKILKFTKSLMVNSSTLAKPASYRYVDGKNSFYLIDNQKNIFGVMTNIHPSIFNIIDRCSSKHISALVEKMPGRVWVAYVGYNDTVNIHLSGKIHFRWEKNHWHLVDTTVIEYILKEFQCSEPFIQSLIPTLYTLSVLRMGSVLLIPKNNFDLPKNAGSIDKTEIASALRNAMIKRPFIELVESNSILGILSSDGLTTISRDGVVLGCGDIIRITDSESTGGGRTHAALTASNHGLSIKVSEDGPITIFKDAKCHGAG